MKLQILFSFFSLVFGLQYISAQQAKHSLSFTTITDSTGKSIGAKRIKMNPGAAKFYPTYGIIPAEEVVPMQFAANVYNSGTVAQTNVRLEVEIRQYGVTVSIMTSPAIDTLKSGDTLLLSELGSTSSWTPPANPGMYDFIWRIVSDSIGTGPNASVAPVNDTVTFEITDDINGNHEYGIDWGTLDNYFGTADGITSVGVAYAFPEASQDTSGYVFLESLQTQLHQDIDTTGEISLSIYDTTGFRYGPQSQGPTDTLFTRTYPLSADLAGNYASFDLRVQSNGWWCPLSLPANKAYYFVLEFSPKAQSGTISIGNNQTLEHTGHFTPFQSGDPDKSVIIQSSQGGWYSSSGYPQVENPVMRVKMAELGHHSSPCYLGMNEPEVGAAFSLYPNPGNGELQIEFTEAGPCRLKLISITGEVVHEEKLSLKPDEKLYRDFSHLPKGVYLINLSQGSASSSKKLIIE